MSDSCFGFFLDIPLVCFSSSCFSFFPFPSSLFLSGCLPARRTTPWLPPWRWPDPLTPAAPPATCPALVTRARAARPTGGRSPCLRGERFSDLLHHRAVSLSSLLRFHPHAPVVVPFRSHPPLSVSLGVNPTACVFQVCPEQTLSSPAGATDDGRRQRQVHTELAPSGRLRESSSSRSEQQIYPQCCLASFCYWCAVGFSPYTSLKKKKVTWWCFSAFFVRVHGLTRSSSHACRPLSAQLSVLHCKSTFLNYTLKRLQTVLCSINKASSRFFSSVHRPSRLLYRSYDIFLEYRSTCMFGGGTFHLSLP